jgi:hypothetical protein
MLSLSYDGGQRQVPAPFMPLPFLEDTGIILVMII